jgi:hypothetical protein
MRRRENAGNGAPASSEEKLSMGPARRGYACESLEEAQFLLRPLMGSASASAMMRSPGQYQ